MYDHYIGLDWAQQNMAIARLTAVKDKPQVWERPSDLGLLKSYLSELKGKKILTFEETTTSQWLYTELRECVDELIVCDPSRNRLLSEGPKNDKIDALKLATLLRGDLLKPVYHSGDIFIGYRKLVSAHESLVRTLVQRKNKRTSVIHSLGLSKKTKELTDAATEKFILDGLEQEILLLEQQRKRYEAVFNEIILKHRKVSCLVTIPGIGPIGAMRIASRVVDGRRFKTRNQFLSYCGLVKYEKMSGGRSYGKKSSQYSRLLKDVFKTAAVIVIYSSSPQNYFLKTYRWLIEEKKYPEFQARHAIARKIAIVAYGLIKNEESFDENKLRSATEK